MVAIKIRQLIDLAIGFPEAGHVNFSALHCLLICMAEKLKITDDSLNYNEIDYEKHQERSKLSKHLVSKKQARLIGGLNPNEDQHNGNDNGKGKDNEQEQDKEPPKAPDENSLTQTVGEEPQVKVDPQDNNDEVAKEETAEVAIEATQETAITSMSDAEQQSITQPADSPRNSGLSEELPLERTIERAMSAAFSSDDNMMPVAEDLLSGISILKHQLEFVIEQLLLLTFITLSKKPDSQQVQQLYSMSQTLDELKKENKAIRGLKQDTLPFELSLNWVSSNLRINGEETVAGNILMEANNDMAAEASPGSSYDTLEGHLCYSPAKLLDQLMSLKSEFCRLTNNVNELSARLLEQESHHLLSLVQEIHKQIRDIKLTNMELKDNHSHLDRRITTNHNRLDKLKGSLEEMSEKMVDKTYFDLQLANKADYNQLQAKASLDQILELQCRSDKQFHEIYKRLDANDKKLLDTTEDLKSTLGPTALNEVLAKFKETIANDMQQLNELLRSYVESTNDDCAAAGGRIKVLQDLACLSCDTNCVMPVREKARVAKLPSAHASNIISPLVTYELGSIRKSGLMGYYRKDDFPHAPNAWLTQQSLAMGNPPKPSSMRHAGGQHTTNNAKERFHKTVFNGK